MVSAKASAKKGTWRYRIPHHQALVEQAMTAAPPRGSAGPAIAPFAAGSSIPAYKWCRPHLGDSTSLSAVRDLLWQRHYLFWWGTVCASPVLNDHLGYQAY
jgi:hypothetical protein